MGSNINPLVSIVIPCYNHENYVQDCIKSIIEQDYKNIELIIIDDGSKDDSVSKIKALIQECEKRFVRFEFRTRANKGLCGTLNEAIAWCEGVFYSAIASDDMMLPEKTSLQVRYLLENPECDVLFGGMYLVDGSGIVLKKRNGFNGILTFKDIFLVQKNFAAPTQMIKLKSLRAAGPYPEGVYIEDWYMWLRISHLGYIIHSTAAPLVYYRRHESNMSSKIEIMNSARIAIIDKYKTSALYPKAKATCLLLTAIELQKIDQKNSFIFFFEAIGIDPFIVAQKRAFYYLLKIIYIPLSRILKSRILNP